MTIRDRLLRLLLPVVLVAAAAMFARAYDTSWIGPQKPLQSAPLKATLDEIQRRLAGVEPCPVGYTQDLAEKNFTLCKGDGLKYGSMTHPAADEMVKVGNGLSAFWIDRYEASVWDNTDGTGNQWGIANDDYPMASFPKSGQRQPGNPNFKPLFALSKAGVLPSASLTWFQALEACAASGKRLPTDDEWLRGASGTRDDGGVDGLALNEQRCNTQAKGGKRKTGVGASCVSAWGAQDMIGNVWEWTANWYAGAGDGVGKNYINANNPSDTWPFGTNDGVWNGNAHVLNGVSAVDGLPAAAFRGGYWGAADRAGNLALGLYGAPSHRDTDIGFRCVAR